MPKKSTAEGDTAAGSSTRGGPGKSRVEAAAMSRMQQLRMAITLVRKSNPRALPLVALIGAGTMAIIVVVGVLTGLYFLIALGVLLGLMAALIAFGRFAQAAQYKAIEGQPGAAAAVLQTMRGNWTVTPAIAANKNMDVVHRAVGRVGVVLVGEGSPNRLPSLLAAEKKRVSRVAYEIPIYDIQIGDGEGQIPISRLQRHVMRLPRNLKSGEVSDLNYRLKALPQSLQAPKGPLPKTIRQPKMPRPKMR
jgi:hypothetical protein